MEADREGDQDSYWTVVPNKKETNIGPSKDQSPRIINDVTGTKMTCVSFCRPTLLRVDIVDLEIDDSISDYNNASSPFEWTLDRFEHIIKLKESALAYGHKIWADYIFFLDVDVLLTLPDTLKHLTNLRLPIVAPLLLSESLYSNFWCGMTADYYYERTDEYKEIYNIKKVGTYRVPMIHSAVLVHLNYMGSYYLTFEKERLREIQQNNIQWAKENNNHCRLYDGPLDDIIIFAISANCSQIPLYLDNQYLYGYILQPLEANDNLTQDLLQLTNIQTNIVNDLGKVVDVLDYLEKFKPKSEKHKLTLDHIYMINLNRRPERRLKMEKLFAILNLDVEHFPAVDGKELNLDIINEMGIKFLPGYEDPYHHRQMTMGEIGCFLSHYRIWEKIVENKLKEVLILEDDIRFEPYFQERAVRVLNEARSVVEYDLIYFGRKRLKDENEPWVQDTDYLVHAGYSYWTLGYVLSYEGALKLLNAKPLQKLIPVDEYLPLMFNRHPNKTWSAAFPERNVIALSAAPLILFPTHYTGDMGYISDTEDSELTSQPSAQLTNTNTAQLKSDRELELNFSSDMHNTNAAWRDGEEVKSSIDIAKTHEEL
ncbi:glycosyltransferase 25 family member-like [Teleopsis dalmanni]|uniref:glycosyltransferase 25 family member-like n=1 Tax=Teleopsis dalmanni TaxID=139649 RepID=UPI0018CE9A5F|nr:glycosyltransferase 25 family member-like [Teleopsis dalmanni]